MVLTARREATTKGQGDAHEITAVVAQAIAYLSAPAFEELAPRRGQYRHHLRWGDDNGSSHVRAATLGRRLAVPFVGGAPALGTWQQITLLEFDTRPRRREHVIQIVGE